MKETISINSSQVVTIENEIVGGILLDIAPIKSDDSVCDIADLNKASLEIAVFRNGESRPKYFCNDYLDYILRAITSSWMGYTVATTKRAAGYLMAIPFNGALNLQKGDRIEVIFKVQNTTFTSLDLSKSSINIESVPATVGSNVVSVVEAHTYITGSLDLDKNLGNNIEKIVLVNDLGADYGASAKAKPLNGIVLTAQGFEKRATENLLLAENYRSLQNNPETAVKNLVVYNDYMNPIHNVRLTSKFDVAVEATARLMVMRKAVL
ncbi:hypothetical protein [Flavivirga sp. 57AJ16]|uniref:hypothetical protein n=1 Tax=Flavivirga sp. 57AJ16 TaxID=3025307 RepID=UPI002366406B|nr:hypothetical protein [Flavivirga sp. 57AJ16]MDD7885743.1 hypothetical protein [Flavivirga sp. 57AJ16]